MAANADAIRTAISDIDIDKEKEKEKKMELLSLSLSLSLPFSLALSLSRSLGHTHFLSHIFFYSGGANSFLPLYYSQQKSFIGIHRKMKEQFTSH